MTVSYTHLDVYKRQRERCVWEFQGAETELWKLPPDPLLEAVAKMLSPEQPEWSGTPTELLERLPGVSIQDVYKRHMRGYLTYGLPLIVLFIFVFGLYDKFIA